MPDEKLRVADVLRCCWHTFNSNHRLPPCVAHTVNELLSCRSAALGGHIYTCDQCGAEIPVYNSCKNRNCPTCQNIEKAKWLRKRLRDVLPVPYYHVVFTLPHDLNRLVNGNRRLLFDELFHAAKWVLQRFAHDPQWRLEGELGMLAILHTWNQRLGQHIHVHFLIPGGVWREDSQTFVTCKNNWLFGKSSLAKAFRSRFIKRLRKLRASGKLNYRASCKELNDDESWNELLNKLQEVKWIVYPKLVPASPEKALEYLARYTYRIAITDYRIKNIENGYVTYTWRDRSDRNREKTDTISVDEFTRRFIQHILPSGFKKIRFFGWMSNAKRKYILPLIRKCLHIERPEPVSIERCEQTLFQTKEFDIRRCPKCNQGILLKTSIIQQTAQGP